MAEDLPFLDETFDITHSRLAFHHFKDVWEPFSEMARVTKKGGRVVLVDMEASAEPYRVIRDKIERLRDPSHVRNLTQDEMLALFKGEGLTVEMSTSKVIPQKLTPWLTLSGASKKDGRKSAASWKRNSPAVIRRDSTRTVSTGISDSTTSGS